MAPVRQNRGQGGQRRSARSGEVREESTHSLAVVAGSRAGLGQLVLWLKVLGVGGVGVGWYGVVTL